MKSMLHLAKGLSLPAEDFVESKSAILGASGGGKSGALKVIEEELVRCRLPFVVFDPAGVAWGLRSSLDGKGPGLQVLVVGGEHGDVPLNRNAGAEMAREVVRANCQVIFDLSDESTGTYQKFLADFCEEFYIAQGKSRTPRLVIIDEAHEILPQDVRRAESPAFAAARKLVTRGRNRGIGVCLVSQRPAGIAKSVLTQCGSLFIFGVLGTPDRKAIGDWVSAWGDQDRLDEFDSGIASLKQQECWFWSPREFQRFEKVRIRDFNTFHPDYTHLRRMGLLEVQPVTADVATLVARLSAEVAKVKAEKVEAGEVPKLRRRVADLELENAALKPAATERYDWKRHADEVELRETKLRTALAESEKHRGEGWQAYNSLRSFVEGALVGMQREVGKITNTRSQIPITVTTAGPSNDTRGFTEVLAKIPRAAAGPVGPLAMKGSQLSSQRPIPKAAAPTVSTRGREPGVHTLDSPGDHTEEPSLKAGAIRMLAELASRHPLTLTYAQLATLAGFTPSGGTSSTYFSTLRRIGYIEEDRSGGVHVTQQGFDFLGSDIPPTPSTHAEIMDRWRRALKKGCFEMLVEVAKHYPEPITKEELADATDFTVTGGTFSTYGSILRRNGLIEIAGNEIRATEILWP